MYLYDEIMLLYTAEWSFSICVRCAIFYILIIHVNNISIPIFDIEVHGGVCLSDFILHFLYADTAELNFSLKLQLCYTVDFFFLSFLLHIVSQDWWQWIST